MCLKFPNSAISQPNCDGFIPLATGSLNRGHGTIRKPRIYSEVERDSVRLSYVENISGYSYKRLIGC